MNSRKRAIGEQVLQMSLVLNNIRDEVLMASLLQYGYDEARINEGQVLYNAVLEGIEAMDTAKVLQNQAMVTFNEAYQKASLAYRDHVARARRALAGDPGAIRELGMAGKQPAVFENWFKRARSFYCNLLGNASIRDRLTRFGVSVVSLQDGQYLLNLLENLYAAKKNRIGLTQTATAERDRRLKAMHVWYADLISMARLAFRNDVQQLERFGIVQFAPGVRSRKKNLPPPAEGVTPGMATNLDNPAAE